MVYLNQQQLLPYDRLAQLCEDLFGQPLSVATLAAANERAYQQLDPFAQALARQVPQAPVVHLDESGLRVAGDAPLAACGLDGHADLLRRASQARRRGDGRLGHRGRLPPVGRA